MSSELIYRVVLLGVVHWILAGFVLHDLVNRQKVIGGRKWPWVVAVVLITCIGSLVYLLFHPQMLNRD